MYNTFGSNVAYISAHSAENKRQKLEILTSFNGCCLKQFGDKWLIVHMPLSFIILISFCGVGWGWADSQNPILIKITIKISLILMIIYQII